jgi:hypothetical protein
MEIAIALDTYDDLFSDFDPGSYGQRALSKDFLDELRVRLRRIGASPGQCIVLLIPEDERRIDDEGLIIERIKAFFSERQERYREKDRRAKRRSLIYVIIGLVLSVAANFFVWRFEPLPLFRDFLLIPSWFFVWSGFELFIKSRDEIGQKKKYYAALSGSLIEFRLREGYVEDCAHV